MLCFSFRNSGKNPALAMARDFRVFAGVLKGVLGKVGV
jgi:hypothetical protein